MCNDRGNTDTGCSREIVGDLWRRPRSLGLEELATARVEDLVRRAGVGTAKAAGLVAAFELGRRVRTDRESLILRRSADLAEVAVPELAGLQRERLIVLVCNGANRLKAIERISEGAADRALVPVREILSAVLRHDGRAFGVAHNHPSGDPRPSQDDIRLTRQLADAGKTMHIEVLDHVIIGKPENRGKAKDEDERTKGYFSLKREGLF